MERDVYFDTALKLLAEGEITEEVFNVMIDNADAFVEED